MAESILETATAVMSENGAAALSLGEVARRLGIKTPSLYVYFDIRNGICDELFRRGWSSFRRNQDYSPLKSAEDLADRTRRAIFDEVTWANVHRAAAELMFWRPIPGWRPSSESFAPALEAMEDFTQLVEDAQDRGILRSDVGSNEIAQVFAALIAGVISQQLSNEPGTAARDGRVSQFAESMAAMFVQFYRSTQ